MSLGEKKATGLMSDFDPLAYIESAFRDGKKAALRSGGATAVKTPPTEGNNPLNGSAKQEHETAKGRFRKTVMSAPRPRKAKSDAVKSEIDPDLQSVWTALPRNVAFLCGFFDDSVTKNYYRGEFKESRKELIQRLLDPELSLEETARLLGVCPATVRRYTNRGWLSHHRTTGGQRRFRLSNIVRFVDEHGRLPEE